VNENHAMRGLLVVGLSILLAACGSGPIPSAAAPSPSPAVVASASATPAVPLPSATPVSGTSFGSWTGLRWEAPALTAPYETIADLVAFAGGVVAVGQLQTEHGNRAAAWTSTDWRSWTRTFLDVPAAGDSTLWHVLPAGTGLVAIGSSGVQHCLPPPGEGQVCDPLPIGLWTSADGRAWHQVPTPAVLSGASIAAVAAGPTGLVMVGDTGWDRPGIWTSTDGVAWHRETLAAGVFGKAHLLGLAVAPGGWVLTGFVGGTQPVCCAAARSYSTPAAWFSADGTHWQAAKMGSGAVAGWDMSIGRAFVGRDGLVAVGGLDNTGWISRDGRGWSARPSADGEPVIPWASDGTRVIGESFAGHNDLALWASTDGVAWQPLAATGAVDQMPGWSGPGVMADTAFAFATGVAFLGQNGTLRSPVWFAEAVRGQ
jgi:hypothetical protein